jgi:hypothetical protein
MKSLPSPKSLFEQKNQLHTRPTIFDSTLAKISIIINTPTFHPNKYHTSDDPNS